jgi:hypothetical protein
MKAFIFFLPVYYRRLKAFISGYIKTIMKVPKKYLTKNPKIMKREIKDNKDKADNDPSAYTEWDADYKSGKAGKGKKVGTKTSQYTNKYKKMFGENKNSKILGFEGFNEAVEIATWEVFNELKEEHNLDNLNEGVDSVSSPVNKALKNKSEKTRFPLGILKKVWKRGYAAWKIGHIPGTNPQQWAMARVNSFVTGGKTSKMGDKALYKQAKANLRKKKK